MRRHFGIFLQGIAIVAPVIVTIWVVYAAAMWLDRLMRLMLGDWLPELPLFGALFAFACIWLIGLLSRLYLFETLVHVAEDAIGRVPLVKTLYGSIRDLLQYFGKDASTHPKGETVRIDLTPDAHIIGITTTEDPETGRVGVYLPLSYQIGGYLVYMPREKMTRLDMNVEAALKHVLTGGMASESTVVDEADAEAEAELVG